MPQKDLHTDFFVSHVIALEHFSFANDVLNEIRHQLPGLKKLELDKRKGELTVEYNSAVVSFSIILAKLVQAGIRPIDSRWFRVKAAWYGYTDRNAAEQAHTRLRGCCNKVPKGK